jgi:ABC-type branched-subunit amino acid transport system permease subunit/ABC-type branched-subunit amino acid transport system ATPase component
MAQHLAFLLLGLGSGAVFAALSQGLVLSYRSSGVLNLATGAIALYGAYAYATFRQGELLVLLPGLPPTVDIGGDPGAIVSLLLAVLMSAALGALLYAAVFRRVRSAPPVAKAVAALGVMVVLQSLFATRLGVSPITVPTIFERDQLHLGNALVPSDRIWFAGVIILVAVLLTTALRYTTFGLATRAAAESEKGSLVTGLAPERIALANWALSAAVAGLGGVLIAPIVPLVPSAYSLLIVPALAAALIAGMRSVLGATGVALAIGMVQSELTYLQAQHDWLPRRGVAEAVPLVLIFIYLMLRGRPLPERGAIILKSLGATPRPRRLAAPLIVGALAGSLGVVLTSGSYRAALSTTFIMSIIALSMVVVTGYAGQVSFAQLALAGAAAFLLSNLTDDWSVPFPIAPLLAATAAAALGVVVGLPALRLRGLPVAIVTLALAVGLEALWFRNPDLTGGVNGASVDPPSLFGMSLSPGGGGEYPRVQFAFLALVSLCGVGVLVGVLRRSRLGSAMVAIRANERAAAAMGIDVARTKIAAFAIGAFVAGIGGSLLAYQQTRANPDAYSAFVGFGVFSTAYVGGITSIAGGLLGGLIVAGGIGYLWISRVIHSLGDWYDVVLGALLVVNVIQFPDGIAAIVQSLRPHRRHGGEVPAGAASEGTAGTASAKRVPRGRAAPVGEVLLSVEHLSVRYGPVEAASDVSFEVRQGQILGLIGPNGAGKTTVIDAISGFASYEGSVRFGDEILDGRRPHQRARVGMGRTFQGLDLWDDLTVEENVLVVPPRRNEYTAIEVDSDRLLDLLQLRSLGSRQVRELSQGQRQVVSIARSLAAQPPLVLLDEPAAGLDHVESAWLGDRLMDLRDAGYTIVLVDHDMSLVLGVCDHICVLDLGQLIAQGTPSEVRSNPTVAAAYLGTTHAMEVER